VKHNNPQLPYWIFNCQNQTIFIISSCHYSRHWLHLMIEYIIICSKFQTKTIYKNLHPWLSWSPFQKQLKRFSHDVSVKAYLQRILNVQKYHNV
jgi:hypothetical protein